jgi:signal transduction histidine kinase
MKTELITNVSHDIKTPLTSIINYASLMGTTDPSDPKMAEYSEVVVRQSDKLKRLIEDLVEASKASTGNLEIVPAPLDAVTFVSQTAGEFKEKLEASNLNLITNAPEGPVMIMADGRRMMRIYDNLMNNICKYAQPGTRVYLSLEVQGNQAVTTFKNTSSAELNISADELVERFVRGDQSRNTEGNGLGLSIAKSMTELQGGSFKIDIDGDLFKVSLSFPVLTQQA